MKGKDAKKARRYNPYEKQRTCSLFLDESKLLDTQIQEAKGKTLWAMVVGPNKPLSYK